MNRCSKWSSVLIFFWVLLLYSSAVVAATPPADVELTVKLVTGLSLADQSHVIARNGGVEKSAIPALRLHVITVPQASLPLVIADFKSDPLVESIEVIKIRKAEGLPDDLDYGVQWSLPKIGWDALFGVISPIGTARVAILDTGIDAAHGDLDGIVLPGTSILDASNGLTDPSGHGTQMTGIVAALTNNNKGVAGIAFSGVSIMPVTVLDADGNGKDSDIIAGIIWAADQGADIILMGFSNPDFSQHLQDAVDYAWDKGAVIVAAAGNNGSSAPAFPAGDRGVVGVSATDRNDLLASYSNFGQGIFLAAPGTDIFTTAPGNSYLYISGTSASSALVAGAAGFLKAVDPTLTNGIIVGRLARSADLAGIAGDPVNQARFGNGRLNIAKALADRGTDNVQPAGAAPVGTGGPFIGPYTKATGPAVAATPPGASQSSHAASSFPLNVTFTANVPATIYYTTSGADPTTASPSLSVTTNGGSAGPISITLAGMILKFFGKDGSNNQSAIQSIAYYLATTTTVTLDTPSSTYGSGITFNATVSPSSATGTVQFMVDGSNVGPPVTLNGGSATSAIISSLTAATHSVTAVYSGDSSRAASTSVPVTQTVNKASPEITWNSPADITYGTSLDGTQLNATSGIPGSFSYSPPSGTVLNAGNGQSLSVTFTPDDTTNFTSANTSVSINVLKAAASVILGNLSQIYDGSPRNATATTSPLGLTVEFTYNGSATAPVNAGNSTIVGVINDINYQGSNSATMTIAKATPSVSWSNPADITYGTPLGGVQQNATAPVPGSFVYTPPAGTVPSAGNSQTISATFTPVDTSNYNSAGKSVAISVLKAPATVNFGNLSQAYDGTSKSVTATTTPLDLTVEFTYNGSATVPTDVGSYAVVGTINNNNYQGSSVATLIIAKAGQSISFNPISARTYGDSPITLAPITASSGLPITYSSSNTSVATVSGYSVTIVGAGTATITAQQEGDGNYNAALAVPQALVVNKATLTVKALDVSRYYGVANPLFTAGYTGLVNGELAAVLGGAPAFATNATDLSPVDTYPISVTQGSLYSSNYAFVFIDGNLSVTKAPATVTLGNLDVTYDGTVKTAASSTSPLGLTVMMTYNGSTTAPANAGSYTVVGTINDANYQGSATGTLTIAKANQTITFYPLPPRTYGDAAYILTAVASSGFPVGFSSNTTSVATVSVNSVAIFGAGTTTIIASQAGDANYNPAPDVSRTQLINKAHATVSLSNLSYTYDGTAKTAIATPSIAWLPVVITYNGSTDLPFEVGKYSVVAAIYDPNYQGSATAPLRIFRDVTTISAPAVSPSPSVYGQPVTVSAAVLPVGVTGQVLFSNGNGWSRTGTVDPVSGIATITETDVPAGTHTITAQYPGDDNYPQSPVSGGTELTVNKAGQTITFGALPAKNYGDEPFPLLAISSSGLPVSFTSSNLSVATVNVKTLIQTLAINPANATVLYAGTEDDGIYKTVNGGITWSQINNGLTTTDVVALAVNPVTTATLYAGTYGGGVFRSTDGGGSWNQNNSGLTNTDVIALAINPVTTSILYAGTDGDGVYISRDGGDSWSQINSGLTNGYVLNLAIDPVTPTTLFAGTYGGGVFKSTDGGGTWGQVTTGLTNSYVLGLAIDVHAPATLFAGTYGGGVFKSTDSGNTWNNFTIGLANPYVLSLSMDSAIPAVIYAGTEGDGVFKSIDGGDTWTQSSGMISANTTALVVSPASPATIYAGTDNDGVIKTADSGTSWLPANSGFTNMATMSAAGSTTITALQQGDGNYLPALPVSQTLTVNKAPTTVVITSVTPSTPVYGQAVTITATVLPTGASGKVKISNGQGWLQSTDLNVIAGVAVITANNLPAGTNNLTAQYLGDANYARSPVSAVHSQSVAKSGQAITFDPLEPRTYGEPAFSLTATAGSGLAVGYTSSNPSVAMVNGNTVTITGAGTTTITAIQGGNGNFSAAVSIPRTMVVEKALATVTLGNLAQIYDGTAKSVVATTNPSGLSVSFTFGGSTTLPINAGSYAVIGTIDDNNYQGTGTGSLVIAKATPALAWINPVDITYGTALGGTQLNASTSVPGTFVYAPPAGTMLSAGNSQSLSVSFIPTDTANYTNSSKSATISVQKATIPVNFGNLNQTYDGSAKSVMATTTPDGLTVTLTYNGTAVAPTNAGSYTVNGVINDANYEGSGTVTLTIAKANQTITFGPLSPLAPISFPYVGTLSAMSTSGQNVSYTSSNIAVATVSGNSITVPGPGTTVITAKLGATGNYNGASDVSQTLTVTTANQPVMLNDNGVISYYASLASSFRAINAASNISLLIKAGFLTEDVVFKMDRIVTFVGGTDSTFTPTAGITNIHGSMTIAAGTIIVAGTISIMP